ncbi:MAG: DMT family transporter [Acidimicrobiia bacterium]|nr:DMT family transporter [Acidimicrobiia bacterium]
METRGALIRTTDGSKSGSFGPAEWSMLGFLAVVWGASFLLIAIGLDAFTPGMVAWLRLIIAVVVLSALPAVRRSIDRRDWPAIAVVSIAGNAGPALLFAYAEQTIESSLAGMLNAAVPLATASIAFMLGMRSLRRVHVIGLGVGFTGVVMLSLPSSTGSGSEATGVLLVLLAVAGYALTGNVLVPLQQKYGALPVIYRAQAMGVLVVAPFGLTDLGDNSFALGPFVAVVALGGVGTGIARSVQATIAGRMGAPRASIIGYLVPIVAMVLGVVFRDEVLELLELAGFAVVLVSAFLVSRAVRSRQN